MYQRKLSLHANIVDILCTLTLELGVGNANHICIKSEIKSDETAHYLDAFPLPIPYLWLPLA